MTDEEREKLCNRLRQPPTIDFANTCEEAADEIEWLVRELATANRELEGWRHGNDYDPTPDGLGSGLQPRG